MKPGRIELFLGPMFAGKTTRMLSEVEKRQFAGKSLFIKPLLDTRNEGFIKTHNGSGVKALTVPNLSDISDETLNGVKTIGIDEGQFFNDIVSFSEKMVKNGVTIIIAALDGDHMKKPWECISILIPLCDHFEKLPAICGLCLKPNGAFSFRYSSESQRELIGSGDKYISLCRKCYDYAENIDSKDTKSFREKIKSRFSNIFSSQEE